MQKLRRQKLRILLADRFHGSRAELMRATGLNKQRISQLLDDNEPFGEVAARRLEQSLGLPDGWFDSLDARTQDFAMRFEALPDADKARWEALLAALTPPPKP